jgi:hypothetical protein
MRFIYLCFHFILIYLIEGPEVWENVPIKRLSGNLSGSAVIGYWYWIKVKPDYMGEYQEDQTCSGYGYYVSRYYWILHYLIV